MVLLDNSGTYIEIKIDEVRSARQDLILKLNFQETPEFKDKEININNKKLIVLIRNMMPAFNSNENLPTSVTIKKRNSLEPVYYANYPIETSTFSLYIPAKGNDASAGATSAASIGTKLVSPITAVLFVVSYPVAITLLKIIQALEFLQYINIEKLPTNVKFILDMLSSANFFKGLINPVGDFYKFDEGKDENEVSSEGG